MDRDKVDYFVAKYRAADADDLADLGSRMDSLAEEAQSALTRVLAERNLPIRHQHVTSTPPPKPDRRAARMAEEASYSESRAELVHVRKIWLLWSLPLSFVAGFVYGGAAESAKGTLMGPPVGLVGIFAFVWPLYCLYKLSRAVDPKRSVAWGMVAWQFIPLIGLFAAISLVLKAGRIRKAVATSGRVKEASGAGDSGV